MLVREYKRVKRRLDKKRTSKTDKVQISFWELFYFKTLYWLVVIFKSSQHSFKILVTDEANPLEIDFKLQTGRGKSQRGSFGARARATDAVRLAYLEDYYKIHERKRKRATLTSIASTALAVALVVIVNFVIVERQTAESLFVVGGQTRQLPAVAGETVKWRVLVPAEDIVAGRSLLKLPKDAANVTVRKISPNDKVAFYSDTAIESVNRHILSDRSKEFSGTAGSLKLARKYDNNKSIGLLVSQAADLLLTNVARASSNIMEVLTNDDSIIVDLSQAGDLAYSVAANQESEPAEQSASPTVSDNNSKNNNGQEPNLPEKNANNDNSNQNPAKNQEPLVESGNDSNQNPAGDSIIDDTSSTTGEINGQPTGAETADIGSTDGILPEDLASSTTAISDNADKPDKNNKKTTTSTPVVDGSDASADESLDDLLINETQESDLLVEYETPAPVIAEAKTKTGKIVSVTGQSGQKADKINNVLAFTNVPEIYKSGQKDKIKIKWLNENGQEMPFKAYDLNNNGKIDYIEWTVPHLSEQIFEIIFISKAFELDENREIAGDIYDLAAAQDGEWVAIPDGHFVRVTFEKFLTKKNDITLVARAAGGGPARVEVYYEDGDELIAVFPSIAAEDTYQILLTNLSQSAETFDLKVIGNIEIDYIVDPSPVTVTDDFTDETLIATKYNVTVTTSTGQVTLSVAATWACGDALLDESDGQTYGTVLVGTQCWMQQNLNVGTMVLGSATQGTSCSTIEKYCYQDTESNCDLYGGLYQWDQAMCGVTSAGATGICPAGWHIPTHDEFTTLELATCTSGSCATDFPYDTVTTGYRGTDEGTTMKNASGAFRGLVAGSRTTAGVFGSLGSYGYFWSSVESGSDAWYRLLVSSQAGVYRNAGSQAGGFSLRCLKD